MLRSETLTNVRAVDALQLVACGMLVGAMIAVLFMKRTNTPE
ncbi:MAG: hypothetical protein ACT4ON_11205 [Bacteroidota bacterium]